MNAERVSQALARAGTSLRQSPCRCLRRRYKKNRCQECLLACPAQAIVIDDTEVSVQPESCTECLLCAASCPTEAIEPKQIDFFQLLEEIVPLPQPVVACRRPERLAGHAFCNCAGSFSQEYLLALAFLVPAPVQINLSGCAACPAGGMLPALQERHRILEARIPAYRGRVQLVQDSSKLQFSERRIGRRELFSFWGRSARQETARLLQQLEGGVAGGNFGEKYLPRRRKLLNRLRLASAELAEQLQTLFYYRLQLADHCKGCQACVSMCPTGALQRGAGRTLLFQSDLCSGCGLCVAFCPRSALTLRTGHAGDPAITAPLLSTTGLPPVS